MASVAGGPGGGGGGLGGGEDPSDPYSDNNWLKKKLEEKKAEAARLRDELSEAAAGRKREQEVKRKQTRKTFSLSVVGLASFIHPWQAARERASAHAASPSALLSFFHLHSLLLLLLA